MPESQHLSSQPTPDHSRDSAEQAPVRPEPTEPTEATPSVALQLESLGFVRDRDFAWATDSNGKPLPRNLWLEEGHSYQSRVLLTFAGNIPLPAYGSFLDFSVPENRTQAGFTPSPRRSASSFFAPSRTWRPTSNRSGRSR